MELELVESEVAANERDRQAAKVLRFVSEDGMKLSAALRQAKVPRTTWYRWVESGKIDHLLAEMRRGVLETVRMAFLAQSNEVAEGILGIALSDDPDIKPADKLRAQRTILIDILGLQPQREKEADKMTADEFIAAAKFEPVTVIMQQINIHNGDMPEDDIIIDGEIVDDALQEG